MNFEKAFKDNYIVVSLWCVAALKACKESIMEHIGSHEEGLG